MEVRVTGALARDMALRAHGDHDQKSHGNRGGGGVSRIEEWREPESGATIEPVSGRDVVEGYAVSLQGFSSITPVSEFFSGDPGQERGREILKAWIKKAKAAGYFNNPAVKIGVWHDGEHGEIVIDASEQVMDRAKAIRLGQERNQQGIYHLKPGGEGYIDTGGTGDRESAIAAAASASPGDDRADGQLGRDDGRGTGRVRR